LRAAIYSFVTALLRAQWINPMMNCTDLLEREAVTAL
jgi:hypothetical protein